MVGVDEAVDSVVHVASFKLDEFTHVNADMHAHVLFQYITSRTLVPHGRTS